MSCPLSATPMQLVEINEVSTRERGELLLSLLNRHRGFEGNRVSADDRRAILGRVGFGILVDLFAGNQGGDSRAPCRKA